MGKDLFFKRLEENVRASIVNLACVFMIALLTGACASEYKKQTSLEISPPPPSPGEVSVSNANETGQVSAKGESENDETELKKIPKLAVQPPVPAKIEWESGDTDDDQKIECRSITVTGSRIKRRKICATRAEWAAYDEEYRRRTEEFERDVEKGSRTFEGPASDPMGGRSSGPAH